MLTSKVPNWREGQTLFNFLEWLKEVKGVNGNQNARLADTFHLSDEELNAYWDEYKANWSAE